MEEKNLVKRLRRIEKNMEWKERENRRKKNLIKEVQREKGDWRWEVEINEENRSGG